MISITVGEKRFLNYQGASFKRSLYYLVGAIFTFLAYAFVKFDPPIPPPGTVAGPPLPKILLGFASVFLIISAVLDLLFVWYQNYGRSKLFAFDQENFYIIRKGGTGQIPLQNIFEIVMTSRIQKGVRGYSYGYRISYYINGEQIDEVVYIYYRMRKNFADFKQLVLNRNPAVKMKNWATNLDGIFRLFKKSKSQGTGDLFN